MHKDVLYVFSALLVHHINIRAMYVIALCFQYIITISGYIIVHSITAGSAFDGDILILFGL